MVVVRAPVDPAAAIAALDALRADFRDLLKEACPFMWEPRYHSPFSTFRDLDLVEMYAGTERLAMSCSQARLVETCFVPVVVNVT